MLSTHCFYLIERLVARDGTFSVLIRMNCSNKFRWSFLTCILHVDGLWRFESEKINFLDSKNRVQIQLTQKTLYKLRMTQNSRNWFFFCWQKLNSNWKTKQKTFFDQNEVRFLFLFFQLWSFTTPTDVLFFKKV